jgi:hypothetical protein
MLKKFFSFQGNVSELESIMNMKTGMMNYISKFWRGYYPLLLVEVQSKDSSIEDVSLRLKSHFDLKQTFVFIIP